MKLKFRDCYSSHYIFLVHIVFVGFASIAIWWGFAEMPIFAHESSIERIARRIIAGEPFQSETLNGQLPRIQFAEESPNCRPSALHSAAIIRLRIVEMKKSSGKENKINGQMGALRNSIRKSLSCVPADPFLWLVYYWLESTQNDRIVENLIYLRMSYQTGAHEGWIGLRRNPIAFAIFENLPPDLAEDALSEFVGLIKTERLYDQAAKIFVGPAWHVRNVILPRLKLISDRDLSPFVKSVHRLGHEVDLPGIDKPDRRPWE